MSYLQYKVIEWKKVPLNPPASTIAAQLERVLNSIPEGWEAVADAEDGTLLIFATENPGAGYWPKEWFTE